MPDHPLRSQVEAFICERYWLNFKACLRQLPSHLLAVFDEQTDNLDGELVAACGIQFADQQVLFSQAYLDRSPQHYCIDGRPLPGYGQLAEVGSMAAVAADLTTEAGRQRLQECVQALPTPLTGLINNAAVTHEGLFADATAEDIEAVIETNVTSHRPIGRCFLLH
ncbi:hypothetical protein C5610_07870 [Idiomarina sp. OT37-5b]|nr:hypothetical protein C5610_07870 [Idiomarina sp. OT37-5b]